MHGRSRRGRFLLGLTVASALPLRAAAAEAFTLRMGLATSAASVMGIAAIHFASAVERRSNGQLKIEVYPSLQLATEQATIAGLTNGVIDLAAQSTPQLVPLFPRFQVFDLPFLFKDLASGYRVLDGPIGDELFAELETKGIVGLGWGTGGLKELSTTTRRVANLEDMKGLRIRIQGGAVNVATYQALGAIPVTIDLSESYMALSQHTVDGIDNNLDSVTTGKYYTVIKHVALMHHIISVIPLMASKRKLDALPADLQKIVRQEGKAVVPYWRTVIAKQTADDIEILKKNGVAFNGVTYAPFRKAVEPVYASMQSKLGAEFLDRIAKAAG